MRRIRNAEWWLAPVPRVYIAMLFLLLCGVAGGAYALISHDEQASCVIQARGLPAGHELASSMQGFYALLTLPRPAGAPPVPLNVRRILYGTKARHGRPAVLGLNDHLAAYLAAEATQPQTRSC